MNKEQTINVKTFYENREPQTVTFKVKTEYLDSKRNFVEGKSKGEVFKIKIEDNKND